MDDVIKKAREEMILAFMSDSKYRPMKLRELSMMLSVPKAERDAFKELLDEMIAGGMITLTSGGKYEKAGADTFIGTFSGSSRGFGFVTIPELSEDIFISASDTKGAFHGDTVQIQVTEPVRPGHKAQGHVLSIVSRNIKEITGVAQKRHRFCTVIPDNPKYGDRIVIRSGRERGASEGDRVLVRILDYGTASRKAEGEIREVIGSIKDPSCDALAVIRSFQIPTDFPEEVLRQTKRIPSAISETDLAGRHDFREVMTVTIDGEDAKDLDDAISLTVQDGIYHLGVHIADVSHYVTEGSPLDKEALHRGTSVYFINQVIPMLPEKLSNGICSLNEGVDRLALSCLMDIDVHGNVVSHEICESVIRVNHRLSYPQVSRLLLNPVQNGADPADAMDMLVRMKELSDILRSKRIERGGIDFDFEESHIDVDAHGVPVCISAYERDAASRIIEDFMLAANETVAEEYFWQEQPFIFRSHETPDPDKIRQLHYFIRNYGYYFNSRNESIHPKEFQKLLARIAGSGEESMISRLVLRSMKRARYTTQNLGHFGLAVQYYCHFTSPIRRYPDLQIHRIIKENLHGNLDDRRYIHYDRILPEVAMQSSTTERRADEAEREIIKMKKAEYMSERIGRSYTGVISGLTNWGIYVELDNTCEGLIRYETLYDYYDLDPAGCYVIGSETGNVFRLGDRVPIYVKSVDLLSKTVYFEMAEERNWRRKA